MFYQTCYPGNCACWNRANGGIPLDELVREDFQARGVSWDLDVQRRQTGAEPEAGESGMALKNCRPGEHCGYEEGVNLFVPKVYPRLELFPWERRPEVKL